MSSTLRYRDTKKPKNKNASYYRKKGVTVYLYRENGVEKIKITKYLKRGKYNNVNGSEENQQMVQNSIEE